MNRAEHLAFTLFLSNRSKPREDWPNDQLITTIFTPPTDCARRLFTIANNDDPLTAAHLYWDIKIGDIATLSCQPLEWISAGQHFRTTYSPGVCPSGYTTLPRQSPLAARRKPG
jgi:hypothetical protein